MSVILKEGDKVFCIKDVYRRYDNILMMKKSHEYSIINISYTKYNNEITIKVSYGINNNNYYTFYTHRKDYNFYEYFCDIKEYRKRKLLNIIKECH